MQSASRESLATVGDRFDELAGGSDAPTLDRLGDELSAVTGVLWHEPVLRKHLSEPSSHPDAKRGLADSVLADKVSETTMELLRAAVAQRWSRVGDFVAAVEHFARQAVLTSAGRAGAVESVEDELFRFGRTLSAEDRLVALLTDDTAAADGRLRLLDDVLDDKVLAQTRALLEQAVRVPRRRDLAATVTELAELAASRRQHTVARVTAAAPLSEQQADRLARVLSEIYHRTVALQVVIDPEVLGGLLVRVGDEVIDGSTASKLAAARQNLPS